MAQSVTNGGFNRLGGSPSIVFPDFIFVDPSRGGWVRSGAVSRPDSAASGQRFFGAMGKYKTEDAVQYALRRLIAASIWITQSRFDVCYLVIDVSAMLADSSMGHAILKSFLETSASMYRILDSRDVLICYHGLPPSLSSAYPYGQVIFYSDAGYGTLRGSSSVEACDPGRGAPLKRDGAINLRFHPLIWAARKYGVYADHLL